MEISTGFELNISYNLEQNIQSYPLPQIPVLFYVALHFSH